MAPFRDLSAQSFERWAVQRYVGKGKWHCLCCCGTEKIVRGVHLTTGASRSCGCLRDELAHTHTRTHGLTRHPLYHIWTNIMRRCYTTYDEAYKRYGGRGIYVVERWHEVTNFIADIGPRPTSKHTLERRDNDGPYSPENCYWTTAYVQSRNKRGLRLFTIYGETKCLTDWCIYYGMNVHTVYKRLRRGLTIEEALILPINKSQSRSKNARTYAKSA